MFKRDFSALDQVKVHRLRLDGLDDLCRGQLDDRGHVLFAGRQFGYDLNQGERRRVVAIVEEAMGAGTGHTCEIAIWSFDSQ